MKRLRASMAGLVGAMVLLPLGLPMEAQTDEVGLPLGSRAQAVVIEDLDGDPVDLGQWIGERPVLLEFWARWCEQCEALLPQMHEAHARYGAEVEFLAVAVGVNQNPRSIRRHLSRHPMPFPVLWDGAGKATRAFMAPTTSYIVILDADGRVAYTGVGPDQDIDAAVNRVVGTRDTKAP